MFNFYRLLILVCGNKRGQVAIFVALIFQVLFLFFAMVVNVGLLVHHKINLQNSVDLAAYYGAMKQAEMLNAMAHVNYQIRQSWKLLAWRYRVIGSGGDRSSDGNPYNFNSPIPKQLQSWTNVIQDQENPTSKSTYYRLPSFCINYNPFDPAATRNENTCKAISNDNFKINVLEIPNLSTGQDYAASIQTNVRNAQNTQVNTCLAAGSVNYATLAAFTVGFNFDQYARRLLIAQMSKALSQVPNDFFDIDGESVAQGVRKTLEKNLTEANRDSLSVEMLNGLNQGGCGTQIGEQDAATWLKDIPIFPVLIYQDNVNASVVSSSNPNVGYADACNYSYRLFAGDTSLPIVYRTPSEAGKIPQFYRDYINNIKNYVGKPPQDFRYTLGYEKDPWCMAYVGVKAKTAPKIPFAPAVIELSAKAFAKPFGGRFGPWYFNRWDRGASSSTGDPKSRNDRLLPQKIIGDFDAAAYEKMLDDIKKSATGSDYEDVGANYGRFPGDRLSLMSMRLLGEYTRSIHSIADIPRAGPSPNPENELKAEYWFHITDFPTQGNNKHADMLYWNPNISGIIPRLRKIEAAAVAPDIFDTSYYSIDPNFYENYYTRIKNGKLIGRMNYKLQLRSDIGSKLDEASLEKFTVRDQIKYFNELNKPSAEVNLNGDNIVQHTLTNPFQVLTSWTSKDLFNYGALDSGSKEYFGKCQTPTEDPDGFAENRGRSIKDLASEKYTTAPGSCVIGGRTGYSVKLISKDYLDSSHLPLGGTGGSTGSIKNPPPTGW